MPVSDARGPGSGASQPRCSIRARIAASYPAVPSTRSELPAIGAEHDGVGHPRHGHGIGAQDGGDLVGGDGTGQVLRTPQQLPGAGQRAAELALPAQQLRVGVGLDVAQLARTDQVQPKASTAYVATRTDRLDHHTGSNLAPLTALSTTS